MISSKYKSILLDDDGEFIDSPIRFNEIVRRTVTSFWLSIRKLLRAYSTSRLVFLWDKSPYHKAQIIKDITKSDTYKADRLFDTSELSYALFCARQAAREHIIKTAEKYKINSIIHRGYEADDLAFLAAREFPDLKIGLASHDSDWPYYLTPNSEVINTMKFNLVYYDEFKDANLKGMDPYQYVIHSSSFYGSHNNLLRTVSKTHYKREFEDVYEDYVNGKNLDEIFTDWELLVAQIQSWNIYGFPQIDEVRSEIRQAATKPMVFGSDYEWIHDHLNDANISVYSELKEKLS